MKKKIIYCIVMTMVAGSLFTGCKDKNEVPVQDSSVVEETVPTEDTEEVTEPVEVEPEVEEPETGNFEELHVDDNFELEVEEGQVSTGA